MCSPNALFKRIVLVPDEAKHKGILESLLLACCWCYAYSYEFSALSFHLPYNSYPTPDSLWAKDKEKLIFIKFDNHEIIISC